MAEGLLKWRLGLICIFATEDLASPKLPSVLRNRFVLFFFYEDNKRWKSVSIHTYFIYLLTGLCFYRLTQIVKQRGWGWMPKLHPTNAHENVSHLQRHTSKKMAHSSSLIITQAKKVDYKQPVEKLFFALIEFLRYWLQTHLRWLKNFWSEHT